MLSYAYLANSLMFSFDWFNQVPVSQWSNIWDVCI